ncbi:MAG: sigma-54 dependent transcriptional regulator [Burkholderiaceae bacterium]|nr:sigma-54 dependent transcriptional regulator [Sulfuritalea sp.]MCF8175736.1 sigma-54 dependent transcriptional regulator [Burkholderiaceae bacterium]
MQLKNERRKRVRSEAKHVLVVDDEADIRELLDLTLARMGLRADCAGSLAEARKLLATQSYQLCLTDMRLPDGEGLELVRHIAENVPRLPVAVITAHGSTENAVSALKAGAFDYIAKPVSLNQLRMMVKSALDLPNTDPEAERAGESGLLGESPAIDQVRKLIDRVARSQAPVHITGESGSGKELAARLIHALGARRDHAFVPVNCGAIPETLMESEFFGYRKGAFTGAGEDRDGFFQAADGGTLFLDEVADLPLTMQVKLLRTIQEKRVRKVGATSEDPVDVRVICATHQDLKVLVEQGSFRQDLFYRLNVIELRMPALRECREDVPLLARHVLDRLAQAAGLPSPPLTAQALEALQDYSFPGNVRELENILERALALMSGDRIDLPDLSLDPAPKAGVAATAAGGLLQDLLDSVERQSILDALKQSNDNRTAAARLLGVTFRSLRYRMARLGMND